MMKAILITVLTACGMLWSTARAEVDVATSAVDRAAFMEIAGRLAAMPADRADAAVDSLMARAEMRPESVEQLLYWAEDVFFAPASDMASERLFRPFAKAAVASAHTALERKAAAEWQLEAMALNAEGTQASDFEMELESGATASLSALADGKPLLLLLYDPDCRSCQSGMQRLASLPAGALRVLAVCVDSPHSRWEQTRGALPEAWLKAYDSDDIQGEGLYMVRALPSLYLLDGKGAVTLKNPSVDNLLKHLGL